MKRLTPLHAIVSAVLMIAPAIVACQSDNWGDDPGKSDPPCLANTTRVCLCGLDKGSQKCQANLKYTECNCGAPKTSSASTAGSDRGGTSGKPSDDEKDDDGDSTDEDIPLPPTRPDDMDDGTDDPGVVCTDITETCTANAQCCDDLVCQVVGGRVDKQCCVAESNPCIEHNDCCGNLLCLENGVGDYTCQELL